MNFITLLQLFLYPLLVHSNICNDPIHLNGRQQKSSIYCSSCSTHIGGYTSSPIIQLDIPTLTQITGIFVQNHNENQETSPKKGSYFLEYRRTQDGPWRVYGQRRQRKLFIERRRLFFNDNDNSNTTRTFLPSIVARQVRIIFITASTSTCAIIQLFGCQSQNGLISTRFSQKSIINSDIKYDGLITNSSVRGGLGLLNDGDTYQFLQWSPSPEPILLFFAFDSIKEFHSINLDLKCSVLFSSSCTLKINVGILEIVTTNNIWTNRFQTLEIENKPNDDNTTITHLILTVSKTKGQFVIIQINTKAGLALSEITFNNRNENDNNEDQDIVPSSIYIEANLRRLESLALNSIPDDIKVHGKLLNILLLIIIICALLGIFLFVSCIFSRKQKDDLKMTAAEILRSLTSITTTTDDENTQGQSQADVYSELDNNDVLATNCLEYINAEKIVNESAQATIRTLPSYRQSIASHCSIANIHTFNEYLSELDSSEIIIIQNLGAQNNRECFYSEYGPNKLPVILFEEEHNEFLSLSKIINHSNIVTCFGYVNVSPERCFLVSEFSQVNLFEHCQTLLTENSSTVTTLMGFLNEIISALVHLESLNIIIRDITLPNCLLFNDKTIKLSDFAKNDDRYVSRYVQQVPVRWLPGDVITGDENWSIYTTTFMFGTLLFELFHLGLYIPYNDLQDDEVLQFYRDLWSHSKQNGIEPSVLCFSTHFPRPTLCNDRLYALIERCLSWSSLDRPSFKELSLCLDETTTVLS
ncbi:unnamed protein product [Adineta steineri]|uniref:Protein kinase domain-containing protein n=1 Tax=Adineta steineri TaxID=433720 RepID=A0A814UN10_9BILA|nr:unnamed protein product [Adineta steineri]CAF3495020.1 unnamed protein product [Adineta steineri]